MLASFREDDNFYEGNTRIREMKDLMSTFEADPNRSRTFPNQTQIHKGSQKNSDYEQAYETSSPVVGCVPLSLMASLLNDLKPNEKFIWKL